ncbi:MAG: bifunctional nicotinamidase/pyrazinamidase [Promethearchaeota archaeon]|nr:MAG: bifunctional nicotinamidase/pyrazinamidase [Candidatus Lokiarchaeota archaeon]
MKIEDLKIEKDININEKDALLIVDLQNDFMPSGALPVENGDLIVDDINNVAETFKNKKSKVILTQDWHPNNHKSFASQYLDKNPGDAYQTEDGAIGPVLWPDHCVQDTEGANFHKNLKKNLGDAVIQKGMNPEIDSYSGFLENDKKTKTELAEKLKSLGVERIFICGLALDYCCCYTALDGVDLGFEVFLIVDLTKGIDLPPGNISNCLENMTNKGIKFANKDSFK